MENLVKGGLPLFRLKAVLVISFLISLSFSALFASTSGRRGRLSDPVFRKNKAEMRFQQLREKKQAAWDHAIGQGWQVKGKRDGMLFELMGIEGDDVFMYRTLNVNAAITTGVNLIRDFEPFADGNGLTVGVWDGGSVMSTHQEFGGRVSVMDGASAEDHSTHVGGVIAAAGIVANAKGMAPAVLIDSYQWTEDIAEMTLRAMSYSDEPGKIQISNHSYGRIGGWDKTASPFKWYGRWGDRESYNFGIYDSATESMDDLCYDAPYFLPFKAAGNDRNDSAPSDGTEFQYYYLNSWRTKTYDSNTDPWSDGYDNGGFDTIIGNASAKNIVTVGAVRDAVTSGVRDTSRAYMESYSGWGPTDDGRIKPDIVANGYSLYSSISSSDSSYGYKSGTSMATPNACGSASLLFQYYRDLFGYCMQSATLKGLLIQTADDLGNAGPDYKFGWGLIDVNSAADYIREQKERPLSLRVLEETVDSGNPVDQFVVNSDGLTPIKVTLCWTDPAGQILSGLDNQTLCLVNDLDLRVIGPDDVTTFYPFVLDPANPTAEAVTGDNYRDNVEQVLFTPSEPGAYTVVVSYKGSLDGGQQDYSLILTESTLATRPEVFDANYTVAQGHSVQIQLEALDDGLPDPPGALAYIIESLPEFGELSDPCNGDIVIDSVPYILSDNSNLVIYNALPCYFGSDTFAFSADDDGEEPGGGKSNVANIDISVAAPEPMVVFSEDFESGLPQEWTIVDGYDDGFTWTTDNPGGWSSAYWTGGFVIVDSDDAGRVDMDEELITPSIDCSGMENVTLKFGHKFERFSGEECDVDVSVGGGAWQNVIHYQNSDKEGNVEADLSSLADGQSDVRIRWHYYDASWDYYWGIDNVILEARVFATPPAGDFTVDCKIDFADYAELANVWLTDVNSVGWDSQFDISEPADDIVDVLDLAVFSGQWLSGYSE